MQFQEAKAAIATHHLARYEGRVACRQWPDRQAAAVAEISRSLSSINLFSVHPGLQNFDVFYGICVHRAGILFQDDKIGEFPCL